MYEALKTWLTWATLMWVALFVCYTLVGGQFGELTPWDEVMARPLGPPFSITHFLAAKGAGLIVLSLIVGLLAIGRWYEKRKWTSIRRQESVNR